MLNKVWNFQLCISSTPHEIVVSSDAEECYSAIVNSLRNVPGLDSAGKSVATGAEAVIGQKHFIEQYMMGEMQREWVDILLPFTLYTLYFFPDYVATRHQMSLLPFQLKRSSRSSAISISLPTSCRLVS